MFSNFKLDVMLEKMHKHRLKVIAGLVGFGFVNAVLFVPYIPTSGFLPRTHFNQIDISGLTVDDAIAKIKNDMTLSIYENDVLLVKTQLSDVISEFDDLVETLHNDDTKMMTLSRMLIGSDQLAQGFLKDLNDTPRVLFSSYHADIEAFLNQYGLSNENGREPSKNAYIEKELDSSTNTYQFKIKPSVLGNRLNFNKLKSLNITPVDGDIRLDLESLYDQPTVMSDNVELEEQLEHLKKLTDRLIVFYYDDGNYIYNVDSEIIYELLDYEDGRLSINDRAVDVVLDDFASKAGTVGQPMPLRTVHSGDVRVQGGTFGTTLNREQLKMDFISVLQRTGNQGVRVDVIEPESVQLYKQGFYVEVDLSKQMLYVLQSGEVVFETPIVSGRVGTDTIPGAYFIWDKQSPAVLTGYNPHRGQNYEQPVDFWLPFDDTGQGIHDANWQSTFGGDAYLENGSLGCINVPPTVMSFLYELVTVNYPVFIY